jgi:hypothetical protein
MRSITVLATLHLQRMLKLRFHKSPEEFFRHFTEAHLEYSRQKKSIQLILNGSCVIPLKWGDDKYVALTIMSNLVYSEAPVVRIIWKQEMEWRKICPKMTDLMHMKKA